MNMHIGVNKRRLAWAFRGLTAVALACWATGSVQAAGPLAQLKGSDFQGGAKSHYGSAFYGRQGVNYVYAQPTGAAAKMTATLHLERRPSQPIFLFLEAMDDDAPSRCRLRLTLNGHALVEGANRFPDAQWAWRRFSIPSGLLKAGANNLAVVNEEPRGTLGQPPWFMVARCVLAGRDFKVPAPNLPSLTVHLPSKVRPIPEPLSRDHPKPGFRIRGIKGWDWTPEQYLEEIPYLAQLKMNFLMNCYSSMFTSKPGEPWKNEWWKPFTDTRKRAYAKVIRSCRKHGITFCFAMHPQLASPRPLNPDSQADIDQLYRHYAWAQSEGVRWFSVSLDDVSWNQGGPAAGGTAHARLVNTILSRLRAKDPGVQMIFCPGPYWGDGTEPKHRAYLDALGRDLHPDVYVFWTGDGVVTPRITTRAAESYKRVVRHRLILWDNYPVNDAHPTLHLGPVRGRDPGLCRIIDGYMSNPMCSQNEINRIPLATCADYAFNPWDYDPARSIGEAIVHFGKTAAQRQVLKDLVETYPGFLVTGGGTGSNAARKKFEVLLAALDGRPLARAFLQQTEALVTRLAEAFPGEFRAARSTVQADVAWMKQQLAADR